MVVLRSLLYLYNIGATGYDPTNAINYAKEWWNMFKRQLEGAKFITNGYINTGQDTLYLQEV